MPLGLRHVLRLGRGRTQHMRLEARIPASTEWGNYRVFACADAIRRVKERREDNNCSSRPLVVWGGPGFGPLNVVVAPGRDINGGIELAAKHGLHEVVVSPGTYDNQTVVLHDGVNVHGSLAKVKGRNDVDVGDGRRAAVGLIAANLTQPTRVEGLEIVVPDAPPNTGRDSIGVLAHDDAPGSLVLSHLGVRAGAGAAAARGASGSSGADGGAGDDGGPADLIAARCDDAPGRGRWPGRRTWTKGAGRGPWRGWRRRRSRRHGLQHPRRLAVGRR